MQQHGLVILDRHVRLAVALFHSDLHEEAADERAPDVLIVFLIFKRDADELDLRALHDGAKLLTDIVGGLESAEGEEVLVAPFLGVGLSGGGFEGVVYV